MCKFDETIRTTKQLTSVRTHLMNLLIDRMERAGAR